MAREDHHLPAQGEQHQLSPHCPCRPNVTRRGRRHTVCTHFVLRTVVDPPPPAALHDRLAATD